MQPQVSNRDRWLALGLLAAALALAYAMLVHPWFTVPLQAVQERIDAARERELRLRMQIKQSPVVQKRLEQARVDLARTPGFALDPIAPGEGGAPEASLREDGTLRILPHHRVGGTDGFYVARLRRT